MTDQSFESGAAFVDYILSPNAIRDRAAKLYQCALDGKTHFAIHQDKLDEVAHYVKDVTLENYPKLNIPSVSYTHLTLPTICSV